MLHLSEFVLILRSSVLVVFNNFLLIDATDRSNISSDQKRFFIPLSFFTPLSFFANTPFKEFFSYEYYLVMKWTCFTILSSFYINIKYLVLLMCVFSSDKIPGTAKSVGRKRQCEK